MRVMMLTESFPPTIGGEEQHIRNLASGLVECGHSVAVVTQRLSGEQEYAVDGGVRVYRIPGTLQIAGGLVGYGSYRFAPPTPDPVIVWQLRQIVKAERPDVVHGHNWFFNSFLPLKKESGARLVVTLHDYGLVCAQKRLMTKGEPCSGPAAMKCLSCATQHYGFIKGLATWAGLPVMKTMSASVDRFIAVSSAVAEGNRLSELDVPYEVIPNFVPDDVASATDSEYPGLDELPKGKFILFVGDLAPDKGIYFLLKTYEQLENPAELVLIGRRHRDQPRHLPVGVTILNDFPHAAVMSAWQKASLAVVPSLWSDPCPTVAIEAMASGCAVIASRMGGLVDIVGRDGAGVLIDAGNTSQLAGAITCLMGNDQLRESMGVRAIERSQKFMTKSVLPRIVATYQNAGQEYPQSESAAAAL